MVLRFGPEEADTDHQAWVVTRLTRPMPCADGGHCPRTSHAARRQQSIKISWQSSWYAHPDRWRQQSIILRPIHIFIDPTIDQLIARSINQSEVDCRPVRTMDGIYINSPTKAVQRNMTHICLPASVLSRTPLPTIVSTANAYANASDECPRLPRSHSTGQVLFKSLFAHPSIRIFKIGDGSSLASRYTLLA